MTGGVSKQRRGILGKPRRFSDVVAWAAGVLIVSPPLLLALWAIPDWILGVRIAREDIAVGGESAAAAWGSVRVLNGALIAMALGTAVLVGAFIVPRLMLSWRRSHTKMQR